MLLIIFMVLTPKTVPELSVRLPPDSARPGPSAGHDQFRVGLDQAGVVSLNGTSYRTIAEFRSELETGLTHRARKVVFVDFDDNASYGAAVGTLGVIKEAGAQVIAVIKKPPTEVLLSS